MGISMAIVSGLGILVLGFVFYAMIDAWSLNKKRQAEKEVAIEAIKAGLVQAPVPRTVIGPYGFTKEITELAWVEQT